MPDRIGFIGLGHLGSGIAGVLAEDGHEVHGLDLDPARMKAAEARGIIAEASPSDVAAASEIVFTCLPQSDVVAEVCLGPRGIVAGGREGLLVIDCTSGFPARTLEIAAALAEKGIRMIDAPVTGGDGGSVAAPNRAITMIVGGADADVRRAWPYLESLSKHLFHVGPLGHGHLVKAINNMVSFASRMATIEGLLVAAKHGIDPGIVAKVLVNGTGMTAMAQRVEATGSAASGGNRQGGFSIGLMTKDLRHMSQIARESGVPGLVTDHVFHLAEIITRTVGHDTDILNATAALEEWAGVKLA